MQQISDKIFFFLLWVSKQVLLFILRVTGIALAALCILTGNLLVYIGQGLETAILRKLSK